MESVFLKASLDISARGIHKHKPFFLIIMSQEVKPNAKFKINATLFVVVCWFKEYALSFDIGFSL